MEEAIGFVINLALWFVLGWHFRGLREERRQADNMRVMFSILEAHTSDHSDGLDAPP